MKRSYDAPAYLPARSTVTLRDPRADARILLWLLLATTALCLLDIYHSCR